MIEQQNDNEQYNVNFNEVDNYIKTGYRNSKESNKKIFKGIITTMLIIAAIIIGSEIATFINSERYINAVKTAYNSNAQLTYSQAVSNVIFYPEWNYYETDSGNNIILCTGMSDIGKLTIRFLLEDVGDDYVYISIVDMEVNGQVLSELEQLAVEVAMAGYYQ